MFYAHFVLAKKGPLARIWLAAHWDKKLTKAHVFETNIESSVEGILAPKVKLALRTSGHLLLGIVRIYSRKAKYLLADCNEAFIKIKMAFRPGVVDLPEGNREAAVATITLPEVFHDFDTAMPDISIDMDAQVTLNQSRAEDITLKEDYGTLSLMTDDGFGDMGFDVEEGVRDATNIDEGFDHTSLMLCDDRSKDKLDEQGTSGACMNSKQSAMLDANLKDDDGFDGPATCLLDSDAGGLFGPSALFADDVPPLDRVDLQDNPDPVDDSRPLITKQPDAPEDSDDDDMYDMGPASMGAPSPPSSPESPPQPLEQNTEPSSANDLGSRSPERLLGSGLHDVPVSDDPLGEKIAPPMSDPINEMPPPPVPPVIPPPPLILNEEESFALAPLDSTIMQGPERTVKTKRKRKLIVDEVKNISGEEMKSQLSDTTDIVTTLDLAPPTKRLMHYKETGGVEKLFALPGHPILSKTLSRMYQRHLTTRSVENEDFDLEGNHVDRIDLDNELDQIKSNERLIDDEIARKRRREDMSVDHSHLDNSQHSFPVANQLQNSMETASNFMPAHMYPTLADPMQQQQQMMMSTPHSSHMMQQMMPPDIHQLSHISTMMSTVDPAHQLHALAPTIQDMVPESYSMASINAEPVASSLLTDSFASLTNTINDHHTNKALEQPSLEEPILENQLGHSLVDHEDKDDLQSCNNGPTLEAHVEDSVANSENTQAATVDECLQPSNIEESFFPPQTTECPSSELPAPGMPFSTATTELNGNERLNVPDANSVEDPVRDSAEDCNPNDKLFEAQPSDDEDDFGAPGSVGPAYPDEQMADETYEQFEERILTKRTTHMLHMINNQLDQQEFVKFSDLIRNNKRKQVAQKFYTFLVLKKQQAVELRQDKPYGELLISRGPKFYTVYNA